MVKAVSGLQFGFIYSCFVLDNIYKLGRQGVFYTLNIKFSDVSINKKAMI